MAWLGKGRLILSAALILFAGCALLHRAVKRPDVTFQSIGLRDITFDGAAVDLVFAVKNPNPFGLTIQRYDYTFRVGDRPVASSGHDASLAIAARSVGQLVVPLSVRFADVMNAANALRQSDRWPFSVEGTVTVGGGPLGGVTAPFTYRDTLPRPMPPKITVESLRVQSASLTNIAIDVTLAVENPGRLAYALGTLTGALDLNGQRVISLDGLDGALALRPESTQRVTLHASVSAALLARGLQTVIDQGRAQYHLVGQASVHNDLFGELPLQLDQQGTVPFAH